MEVLVVRSTFLRNFVGLNGTIQAVFIFLLFPVCLTMSFRARPVFANNTFVWGWNAPTEVCAQKHTVKVDLSLFSLVGSPKPDYAGKGIIIFYEDRLGYYPYVHVQTGKSVNGGIPQLGHLQKHLDYASKQISHYLPSNKMGLAVIDWEEWRPTWSRNWLKKEVYKIRSIELVQQKNIKLNDSEAAKIAKEEFEKAGRKFMEDTIKLGKTLRPNYLWGYYLFPDCYNHGYTKPGYNGSCFEREIQRNNRLNWLWKDSTALFPSIYLKSPLKATPLAALFARNRILESIRVSKVHGDGNPLPIFVYVRPVFTDTKEYLSETDLVHTVGEGMALGVSGIIVWGSLNLSDTVESCANIKNYTKIVMNPYIINVTLAAKLCSQVLCNDKGVCVRKNSNSSDYLHLNPSNFSIRIGKFGKYRVVGKPTLVDMWNFSEKFQCSCFTNTQCKKRVDIHNVHSINVCVGKNVCIRACLKSEANNFFSLQK
ncbi:hyaluronidase PH-20-like [Sorex fumeus]|uniref:hyaluronidase PH-20-like n=1 Tax=Sorex fumeus TaxID=62283 RepID=UPI0024ADA4E9|nr:hyaluronidase PH-20-like [Sorex fumeus]